MKDMFALANIPIEGRNITNHSGKVALCTILCTILDSMTNYLDNGWLTDQMR